MIQGRDRAKGRRAVGVDGLPRRAGTGAGWLGAMDESACRHSIITVSVVTGSYAPATDEREDPSMTCTRCGSRSLATQHDELLCLSCGKVAAAVKVVPVPVFTLVTVTDAARRCGVSVRTIRRWVDGGAVVGGSSRVQGRPRLVNVASVEAYITTRTRARTCEWCGGEIPPAGVQRSSKVSRRWCDNPNCKKSAFRAARRATA